MLRTKQHATGKTGTFGRALARFKSVREERANPARIGFLIDATSSRADTWREAQKIQAQMFRSVLGLRSMALRLVHFGGNTLTDHGWTTSSKALAATMSEVACVRGFTQILPGLRAFLDSEPASAIIVVGDAFEEDFDDAASLAAALRRAGVKVFSFLEGDDPTAAAVFRELAETTGGRFACFGAELPLRDLCEGIALLTAGGSQALKRLDNPKVRQLLLTGPGQT